MINPLETLNVYSQAVPGVEVALNSQNDDLKNRRIFWLALAIALLLRVVAVVLAPSWASTDSYVYHALGQAILDGEPIARMPNGLPLLEAGLQALLGDGATIGLLIVNILASTLACGLVFSLARHYRGITAAWIAFGLMAIYPHTLNYVRYELTETLSVTLMLATLCWLVRQRYLAAGISMGLLWLFRSSMMPVGALLFLALLMVPYTQVRWRAAANFAGGFALIWLFQAILIQCNVVLPAANLGENLLCAISATSTEGIQFDKPASPEAIAAPFATYTQFALDHPVVWLTQRFSSLWELMGPWPSAGVGPTARGTGSRLIIGLRFVLLILALGAAWRMRNRETLLLFIPMIGVAALHFFFFSEPRFWVPCEPLLMILAAGFWVDSRNKPLSSPT